MKKQTKIFLATFLMLSLIVNIILVSKPYAFKNSIVGTYEIRDGKSAHYAVFTENGNYFFMNKTRR